MKLSVLVLLLSSSATGAVKQLRGRALQDDDCSPLCDSSATCVDGECVSISLLAVQPPNILTDPAVEVDLVGAEQVEPVLLSLPVDTKEDDPFDNALFAVGAEAPLPINTEETIVEETAVDTEASVEPVLLSLPPVDPIDPEDLVLTEEDVRPPDGLEDLVVEVGAAAPLVDEEKPPQDIPEPVIPTEPALPPPEDDICADTVCAETAHCVVLVGEPRCVNSELFLTTLDTVTDPAAAVAVDEEADVEPVLLDALPPPELVEPIAVPLEVTAVNQEDLFDGTEVVEVGAAAPLEQLDDTAMVEEADVEPVLLDALPPPELVAFEEEPIAVPLEVTAVNQQEEPVLLDALPPQDLPPPVALEDDEETGEGEMVDEPVPFDEPDTPPLLIATPPEDPTPELVAEVTQVDPIAPLEDVPPPTTCAVVTCLDTHGCEVIDGVAQCVPPPPPIILDSEIFPEVTSVEDLDVTIEELVGCALVQCIAPTMCAEMEEGLFVCVEPTEEEDIDIADLVSPGSCDSLGCIPPATCEIMVDGGIAACAIPSDELESMVEDQEQQMMMTAQPAWWIRVSANFVGNARLKSCGMRNGVAPVPGTTCAKRPKTCFFGTQGCGDDIGPHPTRRCHCPGGPTGARGKWVCDDLVCPASATTPIE